MPEWFTRSGSAVMLRVHAQPGARRTEFAGLHGDALKVRVAAPAIEDRANAALVEFLAAAFGVAPRDVTLVSGAHSRAKRFEIRGARVAPEALLG